MKKCKFCYKEFESTTKDQMCCSDKCDSKYNDYLANDNSEKPWSKYSNYKETYYY